MNLYVYNINPLSHGPRQRAIFPFPNFEAFLTQLYTLLHNHKPHFAFTVFWSKIN